MLIGSNNSPYILKQKAPTFPSIGEVDIGFTIEKSPRLLIIYRHFLEREIIFSSYEQWDNFLTAVVEYFRNRDERKPLMTVLDEGFTVQTIVKQGKDEKEHYLLKVNQGNKSIEIYNDVLNTLIDTVHKNIEYDLEELQSKKQIIEKKIDDIFVLFKTNKPKSMLECVKIWVASNFYNAHDPIDQKIMSSGIRTFLKNYESYEKEIMPPPQTPATPMKRKR